ncbi:MAG: MerR family transcriptional regulator [Acidobacteriota bacterium]
MAKKLYYKIGEACRLLDVQPYVLRYWETEFPFLSPSKSRSGQRTYSEREIEIIRRVKELLYDEGYTIAGAKKKLEAELAASPDGRPQAGADVAPVEAAPRVDNASRERLQTLRDGVEVALRQARAILDRLDAPAPS